MRLIDADAAKADIRKDCPNCTVNGSSFCKTECIINLRCEFLDEQPTVTEPKYKWFNCIESTLLKARHGNYVLYKIDYLIDNLSREISLMETIRHQRGNNNGKK